MFAEYEIWALGHRGLAPSTVKLYVNRLEAIARECGGLLGLSTDIIDRFFAARRETLAAETRKTLRSAARSFFMWAVKTGRLEHSPVTDDMRVRVIVPPIVLADDDAIQLALIGADDEAIAMILLARIGCLRRGEIAQLHTSHRQGRLLRFPGKGERVRVVPIEDDALFDVLLRLEREHGAGHYFRGAVDGHACRDHIYRVVRRLTGYGPHLLRHSGATAAWEATGDLEALRLYLGHANLETTKRYIHASMRAIRSVAAATAFTSRPMPNGYPTPNGILPADRERAAA